MNYIIFFSKGASAQYSMMGLIWKRWIKNIDWTLVKLSCQIADLLWCLKWSGSSQFWCWQEQEQEQVQLLKVGVPTFHLHKLAGQCRRLGHLQHHCSRGSTGGSLSCSCPSWLLLSSGKFEFFNWEWLLYGLIRIRAKVCLPFGGIWQVQKITFK